MEELLTLRHYIESGRYDDALLLIDELEEMSREDKLNKIYSYAVILLIHLIKREAERRTTRSWEVSIYQAADHIKRVNQRRKAGGVYANREELVEVLEESFESALKRAALEAFEGQYSEQEIKSMIDKDAIIEEAIRWIAVDG
jgi:DNA primase large subunit